MLENPESYHLTMTEEAGRYTIIGPDHGIRFNFDRLTEGRNRISGELTVSLQGTELLSGIGITLNSDGSQEKLARTLSQFTSAHPWKRLLQRACSLALCRHREGEPFRILTLDSPLEPPILPNHPARLSQQAHRLIWRWRPGEIVVRLVLLDVGVVGSHRGWH